MKNFEVFEFSGIGYKKLFHHQNWRVSMLNYIDELEIDCIQYVESHQFTDEAFVLLEGSCTIFFAEVNDNQIISFDAISLEKSKVYNICKNVFHTHTLSKDAKLLIIEEENTCDENSPRIMLNTESKQLLKDVYKGCKK